MTKTMSETREMFKELYVFVADLPKRHFYPVNDLQEHKISGGFECACNPKISWNWYSFELDVVHSSFDGREYKEKDNKKFGKIL